MPYGIGAVNHVVSLPVSRCWFIGLTTCLAGSETSLPGRHTYLAPFALRYNCGTTTDSFKSTKRCV
eukprot:scaffold285804_cov27-Prasinocladus_malaysianus.AAC.2